MSLGMRERNDLPPALLLAFLCVLGNCAKVVAEFCRALIAEPAHLVHNGIFSHRHSPINSSGVQIMGGS